MSAKQEYVVGFLFVGKGKVVLIRKEKPDWQKGLLNGVGGKIELGETPIAAMKREFYEETGETITLNRWELFATMEGSDCIVHCFRSFSPTTTAHTTTNEEIEIIWWEDLADRWSKIKTVPNLPFLIPLALAKVPYVKINSVV